MDNLPITPEQNLEQPVTPLPRKINPMYIIGGLFIMTIILIGGIFIGKYLNTSQNILVKEITPTPSSSPTVTSIPDPTANWKTYTDPVYKFSINYPTDWTAKYSPVRGTGGGVDLNGTYKGENLSMRIDLHSDRLKPGQSLKGFSKENSLIDVSPPIQELEIELGSRTFLRQILNLSHGEPGSKYGIYYQTLQNDGVYFAELFTDSYKDTIDLSDQILSTFRFGE